ncbi:MAG: ATP-binding cassette domain-containing protein [Rhizobiaceae bacterium]
MVEHATDNLLLEARDLAVSFGGVHAADGISLSMRQGELRSIIGPNGAGKSTLFKMLAGTVLPDRGTIHLRGRDITRTERYLRARMGIGIKVQNVSAYNDLTVRHNLLLPLNRKLATADEIEQAVGDLLERIHLRGSGDRLAGELSHGQKQWLSIGMTLAGQPSLMLLDEPVAGMGPEETQATVDIIRAVNAEGVTILVVEHDMEFVRKLQSHVTVLHYGRTFAQGTLAEIEAHEEVRRIYLGNRSRKRLA